MGDSAFKCTLCCNNTFDSKTSLVEHLSNILSNISCSICNNRWSSIAHLIEHLTLDNCQPEYSILGSSEELHDNCLPNSKLYDNGNNATEITDTEKAIKFEPTHTAVSSVDGAVVNSINDGGMFVEILRNEDSKTGLQTQELKLLNANGEMESFVVMSENNHNLNLESAVVTKQNSDGTISLQTVKDMKMEPETVIAPSEIEAEDNQEELYSCNTCGVSFSSVLEHIQNYHNDQEVVVEEPLEEENGITYSTVETDCVIEERSDMPRRVITDNGDIVDAADIPETIVPNSMVTPEKEEPAKPKGRRYVQIDTFCDSMVKNINPKIQGNGPYHKVIVKEVINAEGRSKTYFCLSCGVCVSNLDDFKKHPCKILKYPCPHCPVAYENSKSLCAHMKVHKVRTDLTSNSPPASPLYKCETCNISFQTNKSLKLHKRMHDPVKARPINPPVENPDGTEGSTKRYKCSVCEKMIPVDYKTIHQNSHKNSDQLNCGICNKKFHSNEYLEMHMSVHNLDKVTENKSDKSLPYSCLYCNRRFARPHEKVKHERIHTGEKPHSCEICGKSFRVSYCLTLHMRTHTGARPYACPVCGKRFKAHSVYNHHLLTHSEIRRYKCPFCPKAFKTSVQLAGHKNSHTKPFSCQHCNRPFASLYAVRVHTETHARQNNLKFSCSLCGASYARAFALKDHVKQVHQQDIDNADLNLTNLAKGEDWVIRENAENRHESLEVEVMPTIDGEELSQEITELEMTTDQL